MRTWLALLVALITQAAPAQQPIPVSLHGVLVRWGTNEPVGQATVELRSLSVAATPIAITATRESGEFVFANIPSGTYRIVALADGFAPAEFGQLRPNGSGHPILIGTGDNPAIQMAIVPGGIISGKVTDLNFQPMVYSEVQILKPAYDSAGQMTPVFALSVTSNDLGEYRAFWLPPGPYIVKAGTSQLSNLGFNQGTTNPMASDTSTPTPIASLNSRPKARTAPADDSKPDANVVPVMTNYFGRSIDAAGAEIVNVRAGAESSGIDIRVAPAQFSRRARVNGVVVDPAGQPVQGGFGLSISSWPQGQSTVFASVDAITTRVPMTDPADIARGAMRYVMDNGKFEGSASEGIYQIRASQGDLSGRVVIQAGNQDLNLTIPLRQPSVLSGRVRIEGVATNPPVDLTKLQIAIRTPPTSTFSSSVTPDGLFRIERVIPGDYQVFVPPLITAPESVVAVSPTKSVNSPPVLGNRPSIPTGLENAYVKSIRIGTTDVTDGVIRTDVGEAVGAMDIVISLAGASVGGRAINSRQDPVDRATVVLLPQGQTLFRADRYRTMNTDKTGQFDFRGLPPGDYRIFAWEDVDPGAWFNPAFLAAFERNAISIQLVEGQNQKTEIPVIPASN